MPCGDNDGYEKWDREQQRVRNNLDYGLAMTDVEVTKEMACQMARILVEENIVHLQSSAIQKWIERHRMEDEKQGRKW